MAKHHKHLTRAHRAKISRGLKLSARVRRAHPWWTQARSRLYPDAWQAVRRDFEKRSRAARKGIKRRQRRQARQRVRARARRRLRRIQRELEREKREKPRTEEWEITIRYTKGRKGQDIGITMRVIAPFGTPRDVILVVARRAAIDKVEEGFQVHQINWQKGLKEYDYGSDVETGLQVPGFTGLLEAGTVRAERVGE